MLDNIATVNQGQATSNNPTGLIHDDANNMENSLDDIINSMGTSTKENMTSIIDNLSAITLEGDVMNFPVEWVSELGVRGQRN